MKGNNATLPGEQTEAVEPRIKLLYFEDIQPYDSDCDLVEGIYQPGRMSLLFGASASRKTFFVLDTGFSIARGTDWFGRAVKQSPVIYVAAEAGASIRNRVVAYRHHHGLDDATVPFAVVETPIDLRDPHGDTDALILAINQAAAKFETPVGFIAIDTLSRAMAGGDENGPADMGQFVSNCDRIRAATGAHLCVVHHSGKDASRGARGHSLLRAAVDTEIEVIPDSISSFSVAIVRKQRDLEAGVEIAFGLKVVEVAERQHGPPLTSCVVVEVENSPNTARRQKLTPQQRRGLDALNNCLVDHGKPSPGGRHYPAGATTVSVDTWRDYLFSSALLDRGAANPRQPFKRLKDGLTEKGLIGEWNDSVWVVNKETGTDD